MEDGLRRLSAVSEDGIRRTYKRDPAHRIFVNRNLRMEKIKFFGFDMDHTLAVYRSPDLEIITFDMVVERMINIGYPEDLRSFKYKPLFPVRGLWFDHLYGNLLKVDGFGNILFGVHGFRFMKPSEIEDFYPNKFLHLSDSRVYVLNTLFNLPETYLVACLVDYFDNNPQYVRVDDKTGVKSGEVFMSYRSIFQDIRSAVDWVHFDSDMKNIILNNLDKYVVKDARIKQLLLQIKNSGKQSFLLTNSDYAYTNATQEGALGLMEYMIGKDWTSYFNITVVNAHKPKWFAEGTVFREVNTESGVLKIGIHTGPLKQGEARGWRTFLVIPELTQELMVWTERKPLFERLNTLECLLADAYKDLDSNAKEKPVITTIMEAIKSLSNEMDSEYGILGSLFRSGSRTTFFASQVERYADVYAASCYNLVHYPLFYFFRAPMTLMPHESTVDHDAIMQPTPAAHFFHWQNSIGQQVRDLKTQATPFCHEEEEEEATSNSDTEGEKRDMSVSDDVPVQLNNADVVHIAPVHEDKNISAE
ncbi:unnamed protein product [Toxocara canis]|uniref:Cytosolic purine 5'-nucleotidase n=1 Tax=Toxocara canis TaxID=6265 RepID=A0A183UR08_TOXCA|nr:unnamed protein product [Toxocara canis]